MYPILVNTAPRAARSLTQAGARKKVLSPPQALMRWVVAEEHELGLVDDYDQHDEPNLQWRVHWQSGECSWHSDTFILEHLYGHPGDDLAVALSPRFIRQLNAQLHDANLGLPLETYIANNPSTPVASRRKVLPQRKRKR